MKYKTSYKEAYQDDAGQWWTPMKAGQRKPSRTRLEIFKCSYCEEQFLAIPAKHAKTCSRTCRVLARPRAVNLRKHICSYCGCEFEAYAKTRQYCSRICFGRSFAAKVHRLNPLSYVIVRVYPDDEIGMAMVGRHPYIAEHRIVMARSLGRPLLRRETVHHINGDRHDNRIENLELRKGHHGSGQRHMCLDCGSENVVPVNLKSKQQKEKDVRSYGRPGGHTSRQSTGRQTRMAT